MALKLILPTTLRRLRIFLETVRIIKQSYPRNYYNGEPKLKIPWNIIGP